MYGEKKFTLDEFDLKEMFFTYNKDGSIKRDNYGYVEYKHPRIALIGNSGSGKSYAARWILYHVRNISAGTVIAPTDRLNKFWDEFIPSVFIHHEYKDTIIPRLLHRQKTVLDENRKRIVKGKRPKDTRAFFIMDDCMSSKKRWLKDPLILSIFNEGRHFHLTYFLMMQYSLGIEPELRSNFDYVFLFGEEFRSNREKLYKHYAGMFYNFPFFEKVFSQVTADYGCMVINNRKRSMNIREKVFYFKAKKPQSFTMGSEKYISYSKKKFDPNYDEKDPEIDFNDPELYKKNSRIVVNFNGKKN